ncbi:hypothetical protein F511_47167 [Dorcoceras hygrometricum]|uniref:Uncharacterized protein n=1 Tax=Dorcoceras hygrometricum TaxID=472368 RepID=A0A2Z6ZY36_9LAMI|nr:hypothetical protein F511_47167 [Dorcoceras hygrometricum]
MVERRCARKATLSAQVVALLADAGRSPPRRWPACGETMGGDARCWGATLRRAGCTRARWPRDVARGIVRRRAKFFVATAAGRSPLRRVSGDVVTAGLNSSRVLVRACPGQPVKFSGRYAMPGPGFDRF